MPWIVKEPLIKEIFQKLFSSYKNEDQQPHKMLGRIWKSLGKCSIRIWGLQWSGFRPPTLLWSSLDSRYFCLICFTGMLNMALYPRSFERKDSNAVDAMIILNKKYTYVWNDFCLFSNSLFFSEYFYQNHQHTSDILFLQTNKDGPSTCLFLKFLTSFIHVPSFLLNRDQKGFTTLFPPPPFFLQNNKPVR